MDSRGSGHKRKQNMDGKKVLRLTETVRGAG
jgi:hypothetical protein